MKLKPEEHRKAAASFGRSDKTPIGASIVLSLIAYEVMTEHERMPKPAPASAPEAISAAKPIEVQTLAIAEPAREPEKPVEPDPVMEAKAFPVPPKRRLIASRPDPVGSVVEIMAEIMEPGRGKVELADVFSAYAETCQAHGKRPISAAEFPAALADLCKRLGIEIENNAKGVFLLKVRLRKAPVARQS